MTKLLCPLLRSMAVPQTLGLNSDDVVLRITRPVSSHIFGFVSAFAFQDLLHHNITSTIQCN